MKFHAFNFTVNNVKVNSEHTLEKILSIQVLNFLRSNQILDPFQSGFLKNFSTQSALTKPTDDIRFTNNNKQITLVIFDFSKAFDRVFRKLLLAKLKNLGFSFKAIN